MRFNYEKFRKQNGEDLYARLSDFIISEINDYAIETIKMFVESPNLSGTYEGNEYFITKEFHSDEVLVFDELSESHGVSKEYTRFKLKITDLILIINERSK